MEVICISYSNFKDKINKTKELVGYKVEDIGNGCLMATKKIRLY